MDDKMKKKKAKKKKVICPFCGKRNISVDSKGFFLKCYECQGVARKK